MMDADDRDGAGRIDRDRPFACRWLAWILPLDEERRIAGKVKWLARPHRAADDRAGPGRACCEEYGAGIAGDGVS